MIVRVLQIIVGVGLLWFTLSCSNEQASSTGNVIRDSVITATYPNLYEAVFKRDDERILSFTSHNNIQIRRQAWRAMAQTPVDSISTFIKKVKEDKSSAAWFALSMHELSTNQLRNLETYWLDGPSQRAGVLLVLGQQGNEQSLVFLMDHLNQITGTEFEEEGALAVSRLTIRHKAAEIQQAQIINAAFNAKDTEAICSWLYGFYRGEDQVLSPALQDTLSKKWQSFGIGTDAAVDQYSAKILGPPVFAEIGQHYALSEQLNEHVRLGIELAQLVDEVEMNQQNIGTIKVLLKHDNPHVAEQTLANLSGAVKRRSELWSFIESELIQAENANPAVWLEAVNVVAGADTAALQPYANRLAEISNKNAYLYPKVLDIWMQTEPPKRFLRKIDDAINAGNTLKSMYAVNALNEYWLDSNHKNDIKSWVRAMTFEALEAGDRGVTFAAQSLLQDSLLFDSNDFAHINSYLQNFSLPGDIEVYQAFGSLYKERFEQQARAVIDSLAALGYVPLNRSLKQAGWDVEVPENTSPEFRTPNWNRLWELGEHPVWVLETEKGMIKVEMNTLSAPATVAAIDSLTQSGTYNSVPFHRVVPNFVIQGGDIERQDGFGGPDFTIPTEPSEQGFVRGAAGIASAGPDTEGSQYFFMHQWKPHLNGRYTLFGNLIEGMEVVDLIIVGDKVERAYWE